jgi:protoporphyrinogen/coproporphyrinogen III oxidase
VTEREPLPLDGVHEVVVVGGGIAGLSAAYELHRRGIAAPVLEATPRIGGVIRTETFGGWVVDGGPDALLIQKPAAVALCRELGLADRVQHTLPPRTAYVLRDSRLHPLVEGSFLGFPLSARALAASSLFTTAGKLRMAAEILIPRRQSDEDESIAAFVARRFGHEAVDFLAEPLLAGIHAGDVHRLSVRALFPRLHDAEQQSGSVLRAFRRLRPTASPHGAFVSLLGGIGELVDALVGALPPGTVATAMPVIRLSRDGEYRLATPSGTWRARAVILAVPAYAMAAITASLDPGLSAACSALPYASTATAVFGYRRAQVAHPMQGSGFVVPRVEGRALLAGTWVTSKWAGRAPAGGVLLRGFLGGGRDPHRLDRSDAELLDDARTEFETLLGIAGDPEVTRLFRFSRQSPQYEVGHLDRVAAIDRLAAGHRGLLLTGSGVRAIGIPDNIADARAAAVRAAEIVRGRR